MRGRAYRIATGGGRTVLAAVLVLALCGAARADQVTSKGTVLKGKITGVNSAGISFEPEYGKGTLTIKWEDVEDLQSEGNFQVLYGEDEESNTPLAGYSNGTLFTGAAVEGATQIKTETILVGVPIGDTGPSWRDKMRSAWRYWDGNFDLGFNLTQATIDTTGLLIDFKTVRRKDPTRFILGASYRYATQDDHRPDPDNPGQEIGSTTTQDQWYGLVRGEYDFIPRLYGFLSGEATYDAIQKLSIRGVPKAGVGYLFWEQILDEARRNFLAGEVGGAWVYEKFFVSTGTPDNDFFAIAFAAVAGYHLPYGAHFDGRVDYLPAVDDFAGDYLLRSTAGLTLPLFDPIAAKFSIIDEYDSTPAADTKHNSLFITLGLSLVW